MTKAKKKVGAPPKEHDSDTLSEGGSPGSGNYSSDDNTKAEANSYNLRKKTTEPSAPNSGTNADILKNNSFAALSDLAEKRRR